MPEFDIGALRPLAEADLERVLTWRNHPSVRAHMYTQHEISLDEHHAWWRRVKRAPSVAVFLYKRGSAPLGYVAFSEIERNSATALWGFYAAPGAPKGTGSLMAFCAMDLAFDQGDGGLHLRKLSGEALGRNTASLRLHESFGFQREGLFRNHVRVRSTFDDVHRLALFATEWAALRQKKLETLSERLPE